MKHVYSIQELPDTLAVLRRAGYGFFRDPQSGKESFIMRPGSEFYPRFHLYVEKNGDQVTFNLHLDQKKPSYGNEQMHSGEYTGPTIDKELKRLDGWVHFVTRRNTQNTSESNTDNLSQKQQGKTLKQWWQNLWS